MLWAGLYIVFAFLAMRWNRGILPVAAALAVILAIFAAIAAPDWFARSKDGLDSPALPEDLLGLLTAIVVPVQAMLVLVAMIGFNQEWHVEEERPIGGRRSAARTARQRRRRVADARAGRRLSPAPEPASEQRRLLLARSDQLRPVLADVVDEVVDLYRNEQVVGRRNEQAR